MKLNTVAQVCGLAALILITGSLVSMTAADIPSGKGAAKLLMKPVATPTVTAPASMACEKCTDTFTRVRDVSARGANKPVVLVAAHGCPDCSTTVTTVGVGKSKQSVALHTCAVGAAKNLSCCTRD